MDEQNNGAYFRLFREINILDQLSRSLLEAKLPEGLIAPHFTVLSHLCQVGDGATPLELARTFQVPKTSMTHTLMGLEKRKLVAMRPNPADARSKQVWLLEEGRRVRGAGIAALGPEFSDIMEVVSLDEVAQVLPTLEKLRTYLDSNRKS